MQKIVLFSLALSAANPGLGWAAARVALVVGNGAYSHVSELPNPPNDAAAVAAKLEELGFEVYSGVDLDQRSMLSLTRDYARALDGAEAGLVFYAGHGLQVDGENYLLPVDAQLAHPSDLAFEAVSLTQLMTQIEDEARASIVILDACRDNPLSRSFQRKSRSANVGKGLARLSAGTGSLIAFATAPGDVALDGTGQHSPFTAALLEEIGQPGVEINQMMTRVRARVYSSTDRDQLPWTNSALLGEFFFVPGEASPVPNVAVQPQDALVWQTIATSTDVTDFETFLETYPSSAFAPLAEARLAKLDTGTEPDTGAQGQAADAPPAVSSAFVSLEARALEGLSGDGVTGRGILLSGPVYGQISDIVEAASGLLVAVGVSIDPETNRSSGWVTGITQEGELRLQQPLGSFHTSWLSTVSRVEEGIFVGAGAAARSDDEPLRPWVAAFDIEGNTLWSRLLDVPAGGWINSSLVDQRGQLMLSGYRSKDSGGATFAHLWRLDGDGRTLAETSLEDASASEARGLAALDDGSFLVTGFFEGQGSEASDIGFWRVDDDGAVSWRRRLESPMADRGVALTLLDDGRALAVGTRDDAAVAMIVDVGKGEVGALTPLAPDLAASWANAVTALPGGGHAVVGSGMRDGSDAETIWLAELDAAGALVRLSVLDGKGDDEVYVVRSTESGKLFVAGLYAGERMFSVLMGGEPWIAELVTR